MGDLKFGVIGCGYWGPKLARNIHELPGAELAWVSDLRQDRLEHLASMYPETKATRDYRDILKSDVDGVVIATPVSSHRHLAIEALREGKHVLVEKPLAGDVGEAADIVEEGIRQERKVMVGHTFEYNPAVRAVKEIIDSGLLGDIYYINGTRVNLGLFHPDINVVWDLAPHDVSILRYVLGLDPEEASARGGVYVQRAKRIHDVAYLSFFFPNGVLADVRVSWLDPCKIRSYTVVGSEKMLVYDDIEPKDKVKIFDKGVDLPPHSDTVEEFEISYRTGEAESYAFEWEEPLRAECSHFVECIRNDEEPRSNGEVGLRVVKVLAAAQRSLLNGGKRERVLW
jgi:predicted dehydrogenase